jgi:hypothetical protein
MGLLRRNLPLHPPYIRSTAFNVLVNFRLAVPRCLYSVASQVLECIHLDPDSSPFVDRVRQTIGDE